MRVWWLCENVQFKQLIINGRYISNPEVDWDKDPIFKEIFENPYIWMSNQMKMRLGPPPPNIQWPCWVYVQAFGIKEKKPSLRYKENKINNGYRVEFEIDEKLILQSDLYLWGGAILNGWPISMNDPIEDKKNFSRKQIEDTWEVVFDMNYVNDDLTWSGDERSIQGTLWELKEEWIVCAERMTKRK
jgi:hypothetical protein